MPVLEEMTFKQQLEAFSKAVEEQDNLEIDGIVYAGQVHEGVEYKEDIIKILNHRMEEAFCLLPEGLLTQKIGDLIKAFDTGVMDKLYSVTRIVGYYSRISNWNKSKLGELNDRHNGNYSVRKVLTAAPHV